MDNDLADLEHALHDRASEVPSVVEVPPTMLARARRRIVRNAVASVMAVGLLVVGASAGLAGLGVFAGPARLPRNSSTPTPATDACLAADLRATAALDGAAGSVLGSIGFTNVGASACTVEGRPALVLLDASGAEVDVHIVEVDPRWRADDDSVPTGWPTVRLQPGEAASIRVRWSNPCPQLTDGVSWRADLGDGRGALDVAGSRTTPPPPCNGPTMPSTLEVGPFEPGQST